MARGARGTEARVIGNDDSCCSDTLCIPYFLNEGAPSPIDHEDVRRRPWEHVPIVIFSADGIAATGVDVAGVAKVFFGVVKVLGNGATVGGDAKEGFAVVVPSLFGEGFGHLV